MVPTKVEAAESAILNPLSFNQNGELDVYNGGPSRADLGGLIKDAAETFTAAERDRVVAKPLNDAIDGLETGTVMKQEPITMTEQRRLGSPANILKSKDAQQQMQNLANIQSTFNGATDSDNKTEVWCTLGGIAGAFSRMTRACHAFNSSRHWNGIRSCMDHDPGAVRMRIELKVRK